MLSPKAIFILNHMICSKGARWILNEPCIYIHVNVYLVYFFFLHPLTFSISRNRLENTI
jgi:hypothetical protein